MPDALFRLAVLADKALAEKRIAHGTVRTLGTPRRIVLLIDSVADTQTDQTARKKGPSTRMAF